jgi:hypothetical protein
MVLALARAGSDRSSPGPFAMVMVSRFFHLASFPTLLMDPLIAISSSSFLYRIFFSLLRHNDHGHNLILAFACFWFHDHTTPFQLSDLTLPLFFFLPFFSLLVLFVFLIRFLSHSCRWLLARPAQPLARLLYPYRLRHCFWRSCTRSSAVVSYSSK